MRPRVTLGVAAAVLGLGAAMAMPAHSASANNYGSVVCLHYGQTLSGVAARYGTTAWAIAQYNGIPNPNYVRAGTCVTIPPAGWGARMFPRSAGLRPGGIGRPAETRRIGDRRSAKPCTGGTLHDARVGGSRRLERCRPMPAGV
jgi:hypothetical protein